MEAVRVPAALAWWQDVPGGLEWLERLPVIAAECADRWRLHLARPLDGGNVALVLGATREDGTPAVLKVTFPERESEHEPDALELWNGNGAVRLLEHDASSRALLVERCDPGTPLIELADEVACEIVAGLLPRLAVPPLPRFRLLAVEAERWAEELPLTWERHGRPFERRLVAAAVSAFRELGPSQGPLVTANEDLHAGNVLRAGREPWLVIDPKPIAAEREFAPVAMVRDRLGALVAGPRPADRLRRRLDRFSSDLDLDRERLRGWALAHTLAWAFDHTGAIPAHVETARLLLDA